MRATKWHKRASATQQVQAYVVPYRLREDLRGEMGVAVSLATRGTDDVQWLNIEMTKEEASELASRINQAVGDPK